MLERVNTPSLSLVLFWHKDCRLWNITELETEVMNKQNDRTAQPSTSRLIMVLFLLATTLSQKILASSVLYQNSRTRFSNLDPKSVSKTVSTVPAISTFLWKALSKAPSLGNIFATPLDPKIFENPSPEILTLKSKDSSDNAITTNALVSDEIVKEFHRIKNGLKSRPHLQDEEELLSEIKILIEDIRSHKFCDQDALREKIQSLLKRCKNSEERRIIKMLLGVLPPVIDSNKGSKKSSSANSKRKAHSQKFNSVFTLFKNGDQS